MIQHVFERTRSAECIASVYVATDDQRIFAAVQDFGGRAIMTSESSRSGTDRVAEAADMLGLDDEDIVINVQGDQPLLNPLCLKQVVQPLLDDVLLGMSTLAFKIVDHREYSNPKDCKVVMGADGHALYFSRAPIPFCRDQGLPAVSYKHLGIYAYRVRFLSIFRQLPTGQLEDLEKLEQLRALEFGHRIGVVVTPFDSPEVDIPEDLLRIENMLHQFQV